MKRVGELLGAGMLVGAVGAGLAGDTAPPPKWEYSHDIRYLTDEQRDVIDDAATISRRQFPEQKDTKLVVVEGENTYICPASKPGEEDGEVYSINNVGPFFCDGSNTIFIDASFINQHVRKETNQEEKLGKALISFIVGHEFGHGEQLKEQGFKKYNEEPADKKAALGKERGTEEQADCRGGHILAQVDPTFPRIIAAILKDNPYQEYYSDTYGTDTERANSLLRGATTGDCPLYDSFGHYKGLQENLEIEQQFETMNK